MKVRNILLALKDQLPVKRAFKNFFVTGNAWGLFHINSHVSKGNGKEKVMYNTRPTAEKAAASMAKKYSQVYSVYKCMRCDGFHIGRNRSSLPQ